MSCLNFDLLNACYDGDIEKAKECLSLGANVNCIDMRYADESTPLLIAVRSQSKCLARFLLDSQADTECINSDGHTPLILATLIGNAEIIDMLLSYGANVSASDKNNNTPLHYVDDNADIAKSLIDAGASIYRLNSQSRDPLYYAFSRDHQETLRVFVDSHPSNASFLLSQATTFGNTNIMRLAISKGADVNHRDYDKLTPLMTAAFREHEEGIALLVKNKADIHASNSGKTWIDFVKQPRREYFKAFMESLLEQDKLDNTIANHEGDSATLVF